MFFLTRVAHYVRNMNSNLKRKKIVAVTFVCFVWDANKTSLLSTAVQGLNEKKYGTGRPTCISHPLPTSRKAWHAIRVMKVLLPSVCPLLETTTLSHLVLSFDTWQTRQPARDTMREYLSSMQSLIVTEHYTSTYRYNCSHYVNSSQNCIHTPFTKNIVLRGIDHVFQRNVL